MAAGNSALQVPLNQVKPLLERPIFVHFCISRKKLMQVMTDFLFCGKLAATNEY
jgi:hypothetical protein